MKKILLLLVLCCLTVTMSAQKLSNSDKRMLNMRVLESIDKLEKVSSLSDQFSGATFMSMFRNPRVEIYNDLLWASDESTLTIKEYVALLKKFKDISISFFNIEKSEPFYYAGNICVDVTFDKHVSCYDDRGVFYSTESIYGAPHKIAVRFCYDDFDEVCYIDTIEGSMESDTDLSNGFVILQKPGSLMGSSLRFRKSAVEARKGYYKEDECEKVDFNSEGYAFMAKSALDEDWYYMQDVPQSWDPDYDVKIKTDGDLAKIDVRQRRFRARIYNSTTLAGAFHFYGESDNHSSVTNETGVDFRYMFDLGTKENIGIYGGIGLAYNHISYGADDFKYMYYHEGTKKYLRKYTFNTLEQSYNSVDCVLNGGLAMEFAIARKWILNLDLGGKAYFNMSANVGNVYADYSVNTDDGKVQHLVGIIHTEDIENKMDFKPDFWPCPLSVTGAVGCSYNLSKSILLNLNLRYEYGLNFYYSSASDNYKKYTPIIKYSAEAGRDVLYWPMTDCFSLKRQAFWVDFGLVFKF